MDYTIGLQIAGCDETGFNSLLKINWEGRNLSDQMPRSDYYINPIAWQVKIDDTYQTYEAVICRFEGIDRRSSALQIALRIPVGTVIVNRESGATVSPAAVLRPMLEKVIDENLKSFEGVYEYRNRQIPHFIPEEYNNMLADYTLKPYWGAMVDMTGSRPVYVNGAGPADIDAKMLAIPFVMRLSQASMVEIGEYSASVATTALTDSEMHPSVNIEVRIASKLDQTDVKTLDSVPLHIKTDDYGYSKDIYHSYTLVLTKEDVLKAFAQGKTNIEQEAFVLNLFPHRGYATLKFTPPYRVKEYSIDLRGKGVADKRDDIFGQLRYNLNPVNNRKLTFEGEDIVRFEGLDSKALATAFALSVSSAFVIDNVRRDGNVITIALNQKEERRERAERTALADRMPQSAALDSRQSLTAAKTVLVKINNQHKLPQFFDAVLTQYGEDTETTTYYKSVPVVSDGADRHLLLSFAEVPGTPRIEVRLGRPSIYKGAAYKASGDYDYQINVSEAKNGLSRFFSIFSYKPMSGSWGIWRALVVWTSVLLLGVLCYFAGVFTSGLGALKDCRDMLIEQPVVQTNTSQSYNSDSNNTSKFEEKKKIVSVTDSDSVDACVSNPDSIQ